METRQDVKEETSELSEFRLKFEDRWSIVTYHPQKKIVICQLLTDYVPVEHFKSIFHRVSDLVKNGDFQKFVFDKRSLRTFHQASMEWYFIHWKQEMMGYGLTQHRKLLPDLSWFKTAVSVERNKLHGKLSAEARKKLDIKYCDSLSEAIEG